MRPPSAQTAGILIKASFLSASICPSLQYRFLSGEQLISVTPQLSMEDHRQVHPTPRVSAVLASRAPPRPIMAWPLLGHGGLPGLTRPALHCGLGTRGGRLETTGLEERGEKKPLFYDSNFMENSVSFLLGGAAEKSHGTQLTEPPLS